MDRSLQYLFGGVASTVLIAGAIAAFISLAALVAGTNFPSGSAVQPLSGPDSVRVAEQGHRAGPIPVTAPAPFQSTAASPAAVRQLASVGRGLGGKSLHGSSAGASRHGAGSSPGARNGSGIRHHASPGGNGGGPADTSPPNGDGPPSTPPGLASKPEGLPPGLAKKPGGTPPGLASKPSGTPPGLASKAGGVPPGQAKKK